MFGDSTGSFHNTQYKYTPLISYILISSNIYAFLPVAYPFLFKDTGKGGRVLDDICGQLKGAVNSERTNGLENNNKGRSKESGLSGKGGA